MKPALQMFKVRAVRVAALALCTAAVGVAPMFAQDAAAPAMHEHRGGRGGGGQEKQLEHMTKALHLTPDQVTQVKAIQVEGREHMIALRNDNATTGPDKHAKMMAIREGEQTRIKAVLTDDQKVKFDTMMEKMREKHENHADGGGPPPPPGL